MTATAPRAVRQHYTRLPPAQRREQILQETIRLIGDVGFNAVTLADIAAACEIRNATVLHYFPTMAELLLAVLRRRDEEELEFFQGLLGAEDHDGPVGTRKLYTQIFARNISRPAMVRLHVMLSAEAMAPSHPAHDYYATRERTARELLEGRLTWTDDPRRSAAELTAFWDGLEMVWVRDPDLDVLSIWDAFCDRFFSAA